VIVPLRDRPTARYRFYDHDGRPIYFGIAVVLARRWAVHRAVSGWWPLVDPDRTRIDWYPDRLSAEIAEIEAIEAERPQHNVLHTERAQRAAPGLSRWATVRAVGLQPARKRMLLAIQEARAQVKAVVDAVASAGTHVVFTRHGRTVAVLVPMDWYRDAAEKVGEPTDL
jgi:prevent-host-death family protein